MPVLKRMIQVIARVVVAAFVPNPLVAFGMHVRSFGMARFVDECLMSGRRGTLRGECVPPPTPFTLPPYSPLFSYAVTDSHNQ